MAQHFVKIVEDGTLAAPDGWMFARCEDTGDFYFVAERSAAADEVKLNEAWAVARGLAVAQAVREGRLRWALPPQPPGLDDDVMRASVLAGHDD